MMLLKSEKDKKQFLNWYIVNYNYTNFGKSDIMAVVEFD
ncbi:hypothetical protein M2475_000749 [Breznakia sp. PF5-3]|nr:hypothetical protein [Breznakia sp. PM6-1]MDF9835188.1 hypothetical protein [Breznakia sp. PF5-3]MDF9837300.1 hypothetical protein [Breznakia sp. PFB2-8]MDF9859435.1 hypothetical protein [Breznakia sp. PH5-24]